MPYTYTTKDGIQLVNIPDNIPKDSPVLQQLAAQQRASRQTTATPKPKASAAPEPSYDPTEGMSGTEKVLANVGAGMADLGLGARQLYSGVFGNETDQAKIAEEVAEKRRMDERLANATTGGKALQIAGNVIPTLAIPAGGLARGVGAVARQMPAFAGRVLPRALQGLGMGGTTLDAALAGAASGGLQTVTDDESRLANVGIGAGLGAVFPMALGGARGAWRRFAPGAVGGGGEARAAQRIAEEGVTPQQAQDMQRALQQHAQQVRQTRLQGVQPNDIPLSTAAQLGSPDLARLEAGSRAKSGANWYDFDQEQAAAVNRAMMRSTREAEEIAARRGTRAENWEQNWQQAAQHADPEVFQQQVAGLRQHLDDLLVSPEAVNPDVRRAILELQGTLERAGEHLEPRHLQVARRELSGRMNPMSQNPLKQVSREEPGILSMTQDLDRRLNEATGGRWDPVRGGYAEDSRALEAARAAGKVRSRFYDPSTGRVQGVAADIAGDVPKITEAGMGAAMNMARDPAMRNQLSPQATVELLQVLDSLRRQGIVQGVKRSATAGGGSNTAGDIFAAQAGDQLMANVPGMPGTIVRGVLGAVDTAVNARRDQALANALQNPQQMYQLLDRVIRSGQPLTGFEQQVVNALRAASSGVGAAGAQAF